MYFSLPSNFNLYLGTLYSADQMTKYSKAGERQVKLKMVPQIKPIPVNFANMINDFQVYNCFSSKVLFVSELSMLDDVAVVFSCLHVLTNICRTKEFSTSALSVILI